MTIRIHKSLQEFVHEALHIGRLVGTNALYPSVRKARNETVSKSNESLARDRIRESRIRRWAMLTEDFRSREAEIRPDVSDRRLAAASSPEGKEASFV